MLSSVLLVATVAVSVEAEFCTGQFSCDVGDLYEKVSGVDTAEECQALCSADGRCHAYTHWSPLSLTHWSQCWKFQACDTEVECEQCVSGRPCDGTSSTPSTSTTVTTVTSAGDGCPPLTSDQEAAMTPCLSWCTSSNVCPPLHHTSPSTHLAEDNTCQSSWHAPLHTPC